MGGGEELQSAPHPFTPPPPPSLHAFFPTPHCQGQAFLLSTNQPDLSPAAVHF